MALGKLKAKPEPPAPLLHYGLIAAQLALVIAVALQFRFESPAFRAALPWIGVAAVIHHLLPLRMRLAFFTALSIASIGYAFGVGPGAFDWALAFTNSSMVVGTGLVLIAICHLPIAFRYRMVTLVTVGGALIFSRTGVVFDGAFASIWPVVGAFFMFRLIVYANDIRHEVKRAPVPRILAYFFMLPNAFFPFFPVVDWKTFGRDYYNEDAIRIYQRGLRWMARGVIHLILYRIVYYHFYISPELVSDGESLLRYVLANFGLYLRVSGQFHMIVGLLLMFGFNLPVTNHHYFLADSFTDYWRRVNIYWKDFMVKVFYTPLAFRFRTKGAIAPVIVGSANAFFATWLLHLYQSYWLRGGVYFTAQDALFWIILGVLVIINAAWETKHPRRRSLSNKFVFRNTATSALKTMGVFATLAILWSLWSSHSIEQWLSLWRFVDGDFFFNGAVVLLLVAAAKFGVEFINRYRQGLLIGTVPKGARFMRFAQVAAVTVLLPGVVIYIIGDSRLHRRVDERTRFILTSLKSNQPNTSDLRSIERGYYENLFDAASSNFVDSGNQAPANWVDFPDIPLLRETGDMRFWTLQASRSETINGFSVSTNALGLRDKEYDRIKPANTYRIAVLGSSHVMGWSVNDGESFTAVVEEAINNERADGKRVEILNFGVGGYSAICQLGVMRELALDLDLDAVYYIAHGVEATLATERLARLAQLNLPLEDEFLRDIVKRAGISPTMSQLAIQRELPPFAEEITGESFKALAEISREAGLLPVWIYMPRVPERNMNPEPIEALIRQAKEAGFITHDLSGIYDDYEVDDIAVSTWDLHPNADGHQIMADEMVKMIRSDKRLSDPLAGAESKP